MTATGTASTATKGTHVRSILVLLSFLTSTATALALVPAVPATAADDGRGAPDRVAAARPPVQRSVPVPLPPQASPARRRSRWPAGCSRATPAPATRPPPSRCATSGWPAPT